MEVGDIVDGRYRLLEMLGEGAAGKVFRAEDCGRNNMFVALKLLHAKDPRWEGFFRREFEVLSRLHHPNLVAVYDFGHAESPDGDLYYIVMEYVGGKALKEIANQRRTPSGKRDPLPVEQACAYGIEALEALGHLHSRNLLYCDFKVDNAIQTEDQLKLIDMGAVRRMDR